jgi:hypothetical protein
MMNHATMPSAMVRRPSTKNTQRQVWSGPEGGMLASP